MEVHLDRVGNREEPETEAVALPAPPKSWDGARGVRCIHEPQRTPMAAPKVPKEMPHQSTPNAGPADSRQGAQAPTRQPPIASGTAPSQNPMVVGSRRRRTGFAVECLVSGGASRPGSGSAAGSVGEVAWIFGIAFTAAPLSRSAWERETASARGLPLPPMRSEAARRFFPKLLVRALPPGDNRSGKNPSPGLSFRPLRG